MTNGMITEYNHDTGETIVREMTDKEQAEYDAVIADSVNQAQIMEEAKAKRAAAIEKLEALGLSAEDLKALGI